MKSKLAALLLISTMTASTRIPSPHDYVKETIINLHQEEEKILQEYRSKGYSSTHFSSKQERDEILDYIGYHHTCIGMFRHSNQVTIMDDQNDGDIDYLIEFHGKKYFLQNRSEKEPHTRKQFDADITI